VRDVFYIVHVGNTLRVLVLKESFPMDTAKQAIRNLRFRLRDYLQSVQAEVRSADV
jgi:hypothetical protein